MVCVYTPTYFTPTWSVTNIVLKICSINFQGNLLRAGYFHFWNGFMKWNRSLSFILVSSWSNKTTCSLSVSSPVGFWARCFNFKQHRKYKHDAIVKLYRFFNAQFSNDSSSSRFTVTRSGGISEEVPLTVNTSLSAVKFLDFLLDFGAACILSVLTHKNYA